MRLYKSYRFELECNGMVERQMARTAGCVRFVYNRALALQQERRDNGQNYLTYPALCRQLTEWRNCEDTAFLKEPPTHPLQQTLRALIAAYKAFFEKRSRYPRFKKRGRRDSFRFPDPTQFKVDEPNSRIFLPKFGWVRYRKSRRVEGQPKSATVLRNANKWFVSIETETDVEPQHPSKSEVGIDVGVAMFATLSDGTLYQPVNSYRRHEAKLVRYQRALARKVKFGKNWGKEQQRIQRIHQKIARVRFDHLHKTSSKISNEHAIVILEDLRVRKMASAESPAKRTRLRRAIKAGLSKSILDQGWAAFRRHLEYKQQWLGGRVIAVPPVNTSRTCSACGSISTANRPSQALFLCLQCGHTENADLNAAKNILAAGHAVMACEANGAVMPSAAGTHRSDFCEAAVEVSDTSGRMPKGNASVKPVQFRLFSIPGCRAFRPKHRIAKRKNARGATMSGIKPKQHDLWNPSDYDDEPRSTGETGLDLFAEACRAADETRDASEQQFTSNNPNRSPRR